MKPLVLPSGVRRAVGVALILTAAGAAAAAESPPRDFTSKVPQYKFSRTLEAQEQELRTNPLLQRMNESRRKLAADPHRPIYHYVNPEGNLNDPNGLCFWQGRWHLMLHFSHISGGKYLLGDYDTQKNKFVVTNGGNFNHGPVSPSGVHAPSASPDGRGGVIAIFNLNPGKPTRGWNQIMTLPQRLTLIGRDELGIEPTGAIESLRQAHQRVGPLTLPANQELVLEKISGNALELAAEIELKSASMLELNVLRSVGREEYTRIVFYGGRGFGRRPPATNGSATRFCIDTSYSSLAPDVRPRAPETADVFLPTNEPLKLRVFVDRSVVEVFVNGRQYAAVRVYPSRPDSIGVSLRSQGTATQVRSLDAWQMKSIYDAGR